MALPIALPCGDLRRLPIACTWKTPLSRGLTTWGCRRARTRKPRRYSVFRPKFPFRPASAFRYLEGMAVAVSSVGHGATGTTLTACDSVESRPSGTMPARVGRYELCEELGAGAMGVVHRPRDPRLDRAIAIKLVRHGGTTSAGSVRLLREAHAMARLHHPNVVPIF